MFNLRATLLVIFSTLTANAIAAVPGSMDYQRFLTDQTGAAINASTSITFSIYAAETGGTHRGPRPCSCQRI